MKATEARLLDFLKKSPQFVIPIFQRTYSWREPECLQLWGDILRAGRDPTITGHFLGSVVYLEEGLYSITSQPPLLLIDGQQRLTTIAIIIEALARELGDAEPFDGFSAAKLRAYYLLNPLEKGDRRYKLLLTQTDTASLKALVDEQPQPQSHSIRVEENFLLFQRLVQGNRNDLIAVCKGLTKLLIVDISLTRGQDDPQLIFESLNSTGRELSQADLIRNFVLMGLEQETQGRLYEHFWRPMEVDFGQEAYALHFDAFMRHYLTVRTGEIPRQSDVYAAFKQFARSGKPGATEDLVKELRTFGRYYCRVALSAEPDNDLRAAFHDVREMKVDVSYPFLMQLYDDYEACLLTKSDLVRAVRLVESYVFRRAVCGIPTNSHNKTFATFAASLRKEHYLESIEATFLTMPSYRRFPSNEEFEQDIQTRDLYHFRSRNTYWLRRIENHDRKERVFVEEYTVEHIMPQNENLSEAWQLALGPDWKRVHETWLHRLGNLTLTGYNCEYSDRVFTEKRDMPGGMGKSPLHLNEGLGDLETWDEQSILGRGQRLAKLAKDVWPLPSLDASVLQSYRKMASTGAGYSIADHPNLAGGAARTLFEALRKQVLALDANVTEDFLAHYVAYKAETNFVDVTPLARSLKLTLNLPFPEVEDPRGMCRDVSAVGHWGNGDVELVFGTIDQLQYVIGLIRQSFERQMAAGADA